MSPQGIGNGLKHRLVEPAQAPRPRRASRPRNPSFAGYEYQITVTAWVALYLMLAKDGAQELAIEPQSQEDIEAEVRDPGTSSLKVGASLGKVDLVIQVKSRATSPWSGKAFAEVLLGKVKGAKGKAGPGARTRPLDRYRGRQPATTLRNLMPLAFLAVPGGRVQEV
jgi:hypothetical protein